MTTQVKKTTRRRRAAKPPVDEHARTKRKTARRKSADSHAVAEPIVDAAENTATSAQPGNEVSPLAAYRMRMRLVGELLNASVGELMAPGGDGEVAEQVAASKDRVGRGAYLHIMGQVFEALDGLSQAVPLDDLARISRIVAEQRRAELNTRKVEVLVSRARTTTQSSRNGDADDAHTDDDRHLPAHFNETVRQLYGVTLADDVSTSKMEPAKSEPRPHRVRRRLNREEEGGHGGSGEP